MKIAALASGGFIGDRVYWRFALAFGTQAFPPAEARRIPGRLEFHYTPKHTSWLNNIEIQAAIGLRHLDMRPCLTIFPHIPN